MKELFVINIGRQLGSGVRAVGEIISRRLGIRLYDKELLTLAAKQSGLCPACFEKVDEKQGRGVFATMIAYLRSPFGADMSSVNNVLSNDALFKVQSDVIRDLASRESCIFVGRCADYILRDHPRAVNVFITADDDDRVRRIRTWQIAVFALMIVEAAVMAIAVHPAYWVGAGLLALLCVRQLFDRRPERHTVAGVVLYGVIAVLIGIFVAEQVL